LKNRVKNALEKNCDVLIIFDADSDYQETKSCIEKTIKKSEVRIFLFPDDSSKGRIENLLEKIINPRYEHIFKCFESYKKCLGDKYKHPDDKAKIYAYKDAHGLIEKQKKQDENPFTREEYWDFENDALQPLKHFLKRNLS